LDTQISEYISMHMDPKKVHQMWDLWVRQFVTQSIVLSIPLSVTIRLCLKFRLVHF
jgi:hypothetical protein